MKIGRKKIEPTIAIRLNLHDAQNATQLQQRVHPFEYGRPSALRTMQIVEPFRPNIVTINFGIRVPLGEYADECFLNL